MRNFAMLLLILMAGPSRGEDYSGGVKMWFTLAAMPLQVSGVAGRAKGMERFPKEVVAFQGLRSECFGWADADGLGRGHCVNTAPNGDLWFESYTCDTPVLPPPGAFSACSGTATVLGGTGRFAAIAGAGHITMLTTTIAPDGLRVVYAPGDYHLRW